jgi:hypothetical protein
MRSSVRGEPGREGGAARLMVDLQPHSPRLVGVAVPRAADRVRLGADAEKECSAPTGVRGPRAEASRPSMPLRPNSSATSRFAWWPTSDSGLRGQSVHDARVGKQAHGAPAPTVGADSDPAVRWAACWMGVSAAVPFAPTVPPRGGDGLRRRPERSEPETTSPVRPPLTTGVTTQRGYSFQSTVPFIARVGTHGVAGGLSCMRNRLQYESDPGRARATDRRRRPDPPLGTAAPSIRDES